jgi:hypothetical protein
MAGAALVASVVCIVLGVLWWFTAFNRQVDHFQRGPLPGKTRLSFDRPGGYTVYFEADTGPGTSVHWGSGSDPAEDTVTLPSYSMSLVSVDGTEQIPLRPYSSVSTYTSGGHAGQAMQSFHIDTPGTYQLDVVGPPPSVATTRPYSSGANVAVGQGTGGPAIRVLALTVPAALILFGGAVALTAVVAARRHRASHPLPTPTPWTATAGYGAAPAGWFPDPGRDHQLRYWDGQTWTEHVADPPPRAESQGREMSLISKLPARHRGIWATLAVVLLLVVIVVAIQQVADTNNGPGGVNGTYRAHGVSFNYPTSWIEGSSKDVGTGGDADELWSTSFSPVTGPDVVDIVSVTAYRGRFPATAAELNAFMPSLVSLVEQRFERSGGAAHGAPEELTMAGLPGVRFRATSGIRGIAFQTTLVFAFTKRTEYLVQCQYTPPRSAEIQRGCDQIVRTFTLG